MLNLSTASSFGTYWLLPHGRLSGRHPEVTLNISMHIGEVDFSSMRHDAAVEFSPGATPGCVPTRWPMWWCTPMARCCWRACRPAIGAAAAERALDPQNTLMEAWPGWLEAAGLAQQVQLEHCARGSRYDLLSMALNGAIAGLRWPCPATLPMRCRPDSCSGCPRSRTSSKPTTCAFPLEKRPARAAQIL
jgi:hypothetical protein